MHRHLQQGATRYDTPFETPVKLRRRKESGGGKNKKDIATETTHFSRRHLSPTTPKNKKRPIGSPPPLPPYCRIPPARYSQLLHIKILFFPPRRPIRGRRHPSSTSSRRATTSSYCIFRDTRQSAQESGRIRIAAQDDRALPSAQHVGGAIAQR